MTRPDPDLDLDLAGAAFIHSSALLHGRVTLGEGASVWMNVVMRAEMAEIVIGARANIQDFVMIHVGVATPTLVGAHCSITHHVTLHGCTIEDDCLIGINATVMDGAVIGRNSIVGEHSLVRPGMIVPPNSIVAGAPARILRTQDNFVANRLNAFFYHENALAYARGDQRMTARPEFATRMAAEAARLSRERGAIVAT